MQPHLPVVGVLRLKEDEHAEQSPVESAQEVQFAPQGAQTPAEVKYCDA